MSVTRRLAAAREAHWLDCKRIVGETFGHDYAHRSLRTEAIKEAADLFNYLKAEGLVDLAEQAADLGDTIAEA